MARPVRSTLVCAFALAALAAFAGPLQADDGGRLAEQVIPLLNQKCFACHGNDPKKIKADLDLRTQEGTLKGGENGPALVPGSPEKSPLYVAVTWEDEDLQMPPKENDRLTAEQVELVRKWVKAGAPWPGADTKKQPMWDAGASPDGVRVKTSGGLSPHWTSRRYKTEDLWAYAPVKRPAVPGDGKSHPIDAFLDQAFRTKGLAPAPPAERGTLVRRATLDLTGLPPTPEEAQAFLKDEPAAAYDKLLGRLLASPRYGERMAQHWLDVVRYADTDGYANDFERPNAWRYRDYVIRAFNADKPFDRFILEQLAGDELDPKDPETAVAVGFLRSGPWEHTGMSVAAVTRQLWLDDVTNSVGVTFLGQALNCCKCHDHKFDPVPTKDYYRFQAAFASTQFAEKPVEFLPSENTADFDEGRARVQRLRRDSGLRQLHESAGDGFKRLVRKRNQFVEREARRYQPLAFSVRSGEPEEIRILRGGALEAPGDPVAPGVLSAVAGIIGFDGDIPTQGDGRRLALARWIASPRNPLTARVIVNRVWQWHFGKGLVATPNNFGKTGGKPTHPELLDWLVTWFVDNGWSVKKLNRLIMTSEAYRRAAEHPDAASLQRADPTNELLAVFPPRRLTAEELRDAMLAATGELSGEMGGPGVFPEINPEVALQPRHIMGGTAPVYQPSPRPEQRNRRTIYAFRLRTLPDPMLEAFNRPGTEASCERRDDTTVTPQVFALFNGQFVHNRALALAARIHKAEDDPARRIEQAFRLVYGRSPTDAQRAAAAAHMARMTQHHQKHAPKPVRPAATVVREMIEEQTGEVMRWEEKLDVEGYQPDLKPWDVGPEVRGLAELCLVLLNSNEFLYVY